MAMDVYVFSGGYTADRVFNALATFFHGQGWTHLLSIIAMIALLMTAVRFFLTRDHNGIAAWFALNLIIPTFLLTPTTTVHIIDASQQGKAYTVDNVPFGVAIPAHYGTTFMQGLSNIVDFIFITPNDQAYSKSGMLFGSKLFNLSNSIGIQDAKLKGLWGQYVANCIRKDITINNKYTWNQFANAGDIFAFLHNHRPSPVRRIAMDNDFPTCKDVLPKLEKMFIAEADKSFAYIGTQSFGSKIAKEDALLKNSIQNSYRTFHHINQSATNIMKQNMAINAVRSGLYDSAASKNATAAAINYAETQSQMQTQSTMVTMGNNAKNWLPMVHSALMLLILCSSILVFLTCFIPGMTVKVLKGYLGGFFYLATWPLFFTFINMIMTYSLQSAGADANAVYGGMSFDASNPLQAMHYRFAAIAGWLMMCVPIIAKFALQGGTAIAGSLATQFVGLSNSSAARPSAAAATGDIGYGIVQMDTWQSNSMSGNKHDMAFLNQAYGATTQRADGSSVTALPNGNAVYNSRGGISSLGFDISSNEVQSRSLQQNLSQAERTTAQQRTSYNTSLGSTSDALLSLTNSASHNKSYGSGTQDTKSASYNDTLSKMDSVISDVAHTQGTSKSEATKKMVDNYFDYNGSVGGSIGGVIGKFGALKAGATATVGQRRTNSEVESNETNKGRTERISGSKQNQFNDLMSQLESFSNNTNTSDLQGINQQAASTFNNSFRKTEDLAESLDTSYSREKSYSAALQDSQSGSLSLNTNLIPEFQAYVTERRPEHVEALLNGSNPSIVEEREGLFQAFMAEKYANYNPELKAALDDSSMNRDPQSVNGENLQQRYQADSAALKTTHGSHRELNQHVAEKNIQQEQEKLYDATEQQQRDQTSHEQYTKIDKDLTEIEKHR
ncbi:conjugal transfer mating pair stabilization protein TraG [Photobacterium carnosum]|uniref:conjugal transfer mating-pair stabilization protein TraG n=1 Tax=Photobacterium carnosum TaxID=2023717 RepID=UPI001E2B5269|nr:conjugal transfer mating-pair stabilization protein TraG [Photobacterium carnosum]MCD9524178.1 conjugal transfer mating pair stabilization protein TraG [Photobacterium carnosum]